MRFRLLVLLLALFGATASADDAGILASYGANSGSLPPEYAWDTSVTIETDGTLLLRHCRGYESEGPTCKTRRARVSETAIAAIRAAVAESGLAENPARQSEDVIVGGGYVGGTVYLGGQKIALPSQPVEADAKRVAQVLRAIEAAVPDRLVHFLSGE